LPFRAGWKKVKAWFIHLLHMDDSPHAIALGVAIGAFVAATPTWGVQMLMVVGLAWLLRANKVAGIPVVWITNPFTNVPIYSFCYVVGHALVGGPSLGEVKEALVAVSDSNIGWATLGQRWLGLMWHAAAPLWLGCVVVGLVAGAICYVILYYLIAHHRRHGRHGLPAAGARPDAPGDQAP
jgi:hypothetical protein